MTATKKNQTSLPDSSEQVFRHPDLGRGLGVGPGPYPSLPSADYGGSRRNSASPLLFPYLFLRSRQKIGLRPDRRGSHVACLGLKRPPPRSLLFYPDDCFGHCRMRTLRVLETKRVARLAGLLK